MIPYGHAPDHSGFTHVVSDVSRVRVRARGCNYPVVVTIRAFIPINGILGTATFTVTGAVVGDADLVIWNQNT